MKLGTHVDSGQIYRVYRNQAAAAYSSFISSFFFLSNFQTLKIFVTLFSGTVRHRRLKLGTHVDSWQMYRVYRNQAAALIRPFFIFLSLQFSNIKNFCHTFLRNCEAYKVETCYTCGQWVDASCIPRSAAGSAYSSLYFSFFFLSNFQTLEFLSHFDQEL